MFLFFSGLLAALAGGIEAAFAVYFDSYFWGLDLDEMLTRGLCLYLAPIIAIFDFLKREFLFFVIIYNSMSINK